LRESPEAQAARDRVAAKDKVSGDFARKGSGDLYVGKDGNVYRRTDEGWAKYDANRKWDPVAVDRTRDAARDAASAEDRRDFEQARAKQQALRDEQLRKEKERQEQLDAQRRSAENLQRREIEQQRVRTERLQDQLLERQRLQRQQLEAAKRAQSFQSNEHAVRSLQQEAASRSRGNYRAQNFQSFQRSAPYRGDAPRGRR
jgi:ribosomal protein L24E